MVTEEEGGVNIRRGGWPMLVLRGENGLPGAIAARRVSSLADGLPAVPELADAWNLGTGDEGVAGTRPPGGGDDTQCQRSDFRFAIGPDGIKRGGARGYDAGNKIKGRKRHIAVDSQANLLTVVEHSTGIRD